MFKYLKSKLGFNPVQWLINTRRMHGLVSSFPSSSDGESGNSLYCAIVITPWLGTSVPWFALGIGLFLSRFGQKVTFIIDDYPFGNNLFRYSFVIRCLKSVLKLLASTHPVIFLSQMKSNEDLTIEMRTEVSRLATLNAVWEFRGEMMDVGRQRLINLYERQLSEAYPAIKAFTTRNIFDLLFIPGGVWGTSGLWATCAQRSGARIGSFDSGGYGTAMLAVDGIACQLQDIPKAFNLLKQGDSAKRSLRFVMREAQAEMDRRRAGVDPFISQINGGSSGDSRYDGAILIALNSSWDSAALGLHTIFKNNSDWIISTVRYLLENTDAPVIVRQHPAERLAIAQTSDDYELLLMQNFSKNPRLHFIAAADKINSYQLMARVKALVVYTSTIGIEAAASCKPVITPSNSYYSGLGFVYKATSLEEYQHFLRGAISGSLRVDEAQREDALICYYLTQCCNWVFSPFNPADYAEWSLRSFDYWYEDKNVLKMIKALIQNMPISYLNHLDRIQESPDSILD